MAIILYFTVLFSIPIGKSSADGDGGNSERNNTEYFTDFDYHDNWTLNQDFYDLNGNKIKSSLDNYWVIEKVTGESYSGFNSIAFKFRNFTGKGVLWIEREISVKKNSKLSVSIEYYCKLIEIFEPNQITTTELKPAVYIGKDEPELINEFDKKDFSFNSVWTTFECNTEINSEKSDELWVAVGLWIDVRISGNAQNLNNTTGIGKDISYFIDDLKITIEEIDLNTNELILLYLKATIMFVIGGVLIFLAIRKKYEPLLLLPIGTGIILSNIPFIGMMEPGGILYLIYEGGIKTGLFPLLIFLGIGAMTDFGPMLANPKTSLLGAASQFGIFTTLFGALLLDFSLSEASSIGIIGGADGPTAIYLSIHLAPHLLGPIAIAAYSYMALVPIIQPPIIHALTTDSERKVKMEQMRFVSARERILFPIGVIIICAFILPAATPLIGMLMFGNLMRESGVVQRLANAASNELINIVTIFLGISVGATMVADTFLTFETIAIILLGLAAFAVGTATGVMFGKIMYKFTGGKINPMIGAAGVSAVPMAARVVQNEGVKADPTNHLLMHAMGPNVAGVIGSAVVAGVLLTLVGG